MRITKLLTIISFILFGIFFTIGIYTNNIILGTLAIISILGFFILFVIDLTKQIDEDFDDFVNNIRGDDNESN